mgnify:CR=1 FL=1
MSIIDYFYIIEPQLSLIKNVRELKIMANKFYVKLKHGEKLYMAGDDIEVKNVSETAIDYRFFVDNDAVSGILRREQVVYIVNVDNFVNMDYWTKKLSVPVDALKRPMDSEVFSVRVQLIDYSSDFIVKDCACFELEELAETPYIADYVFTDAVGDEIARVPRELVNYICRIDTMELDTV